MPSQPPSMPAPDLRSEAYDGQHSATFSNHAEALAKTAANKSLPTRIATKLDKVWLSTDVGQIPGGGRLTLKHQLLHKRLSSEEKRGGLALVADARRLLDEAIGEVSRPQWTPGMNSAAAQCFGCDPEGPTPAQKKQIVETLKTTRKGLNGDCTIKLTDRFGNTAAVGYVNRYLGSRAYTHGERETGYYSLSRPARHAWRYPYFAKMGTEGRSSQAGAYS
jgi:hypothetical protein